MLIEAEYADYQLNDQTFIENPEKLIKSALKRVFKRQLKVGGIDKGLWKHNYNTLLKGAEKGYSKSFGSIKYNAPDWEFTQNLKYNLAVFAAFKNHNETMTIASLLVDDKGRQRPWNEFRDAALKVSKKYNVSHLQAEYNRAQSTARAAKDWQRFQSRKKLYPNLRYVATKDERTRDDHMQLDGAVYPIDHSFWDTYFPPNDWGCRCRAESTDDPVNEKSEIPIKPDFNNNPGKTAQAFTPDHAYIKQTSPEFKQKIKDFVEQNVKSANGVKKAMAKYESYGKEYQKGFFDSNTGGFNIYHTGHQFDKKTGKYEKQGGELLAKQGKQVEFMDELAGGKTADWLFDSKVWEFKTITKNTSSAVKNQINSARKQSGLVILYFKTKPKDSVIKEGVKRFIGQAKDHNYDHYPDVYLLTDKGKLTLIMKGK